MKIFNSFCESKECREYIEWTFEVKKQNMHCTSCRLVGKSLNIKKYPSNCLFLDEIKRFESEQSA